MDVVRFTLLAGFGPFTLAAMLWHAAPLIAAGVSVGSTLAMAVHARGQ